MNLRYGNQFEGGFYHIFNRGVDKRIVFDSKYDISRFQFLLHVLNSTQNVSSIQKLLQGDLHHKIKQGDETPLVRILAVAIMGNHYHLCLQQIAPNGVQRFMQKLGTAYTKYYNHKNQRSGALFQGKYKYIELVNDSNIKRIISYINLNNKIHKSRSPTSTFWTSEKAYLGVAYYDFVDSRYGLSLFGKNYEKISTSNIENIMRMRGDRDDIISFEK